MYETGGWEVASKLKYLFLGVCMYPFQSDLFLVVELDVPLQEEGAAELLHLEGDVERDGDDVVEEHEERHDVVEDFLGTATCFVDNSHVDKLK